MQSDLLERLKSADQLPTAPGVALRIVELNRQDDVDIDELSKLLGQDPVLAARVIRTANSGMFGMPREVTSLRQAILVLGLRTVNLLALSFSVISVSSGRAGRLFSYPRFWTHTACMTKGMRLIAQRLKPALADEAFLAGLLARFGQLVLAECAAEDYNHVLEQVEATGVPLSEAEFERLGTTHMRFGGELLDSWGLPRDVCLAISQSEELEELSEENTVARQLARFSAFATRCGEILTGEAVEHRVTELLQIGEHLLQFDRETCNGVLTEIQEALPAVAETLGLDIQDDAHVLVIRQRATELLLRESLALQHQVETVSHEMGQLEKQKRALEERATKDALTGLRNRGYFDDSLASALQNLREGEGGLGLLLIDIDHFKSVNDQYGHAAGDEMLKQTARAIEAACGSDAVCCRYGGEEFTVIVRQTNRDALEACGQRIRESIAARKIEVSESEVRRTASIGGCVVSAGTSVPSQAAVIEAADRALYSVKNGGRDACAICEL